MFQRDVPELQPFVISTAVVDDVTTHTEVQKLLCGKQDIAIERMKRKWDTANTIVHNIYIYNFFRCLRTMIKY